jgi:hypothetical protein
MSAGNGFANPVREVIKEAYHIFGAKAKLSCLLSLGSGFRGVVALDNITHGIRIDCDRVSREVKRGIARLNIYYRLSVDHGLEGWDQFGPDFGTMKSHVDDYLGRDEPSNDLDRCITASITEAVVTLDKICESTICEISLLTSSRWYQAGRSSIEARTTASLGILRYAQEANGRNYQRAHRCKCEPADHGDFRAWREWENPIDAEICTRLSRQV